jgi:hypothetical protein
MLSIHSGVYESIFNGVGWDGEKQCIFHMPVGDLAAEVPIQSKFVTGLRTGSNWQDEITRPI